MINGSRDGHQRNPSDRTHAPEPSADKPANGQGPDKQAPKQSSTTADGAKASKLFRSWRILIEYPMIAPFTSHSSGSVRITIVPSSDGARKRPVRLQRLLHLHVHRRLTVEVDRESLVLWVVVED